MIKKGDLVLIGILLCVAFIGLFVVRMLSQGEGAQIKVTQGGEVYGIYPLNHSRMIEIETDRGYNKLIIEDGQAYMEEADCPDKICIMHAKIHYDHEAIICLPHELVVEIIGGKGQEIDAIDTH